MANYKYSDNECKSECPDATYFDSDAQECRMCNSSSCLWCIKTANKCTKCAPPLALDTLTSQCKPCCDESKSTAVENSCCECPSSSLKSNNGAFISLDNNLVCIQKLPDAFRNDAKSWNGWTVLLTIMLIFALGVLAYSIYFFKKSLFAAASNSATRAAHQNVKYSVLVEDANNHD